MLNYKLLIACICIVIGLTLYLFFWNRFVGYVLGWAIRLLFWNQGESSVWIDIGSIHFSLIAGRVLFKDLQYHSSNQTIRVVKGQISWRYWLRAPAGQEDLSHARVMGEDTGLATQKKAPLACRLHMSLQGLEWFIYNRIAAYDNIVSSMESSVADPPENRGRPSGEGIGSLRKIFSWSSVIPDNVHVGPPVSLISSIITWTPEVVKKSLTWSKGQLPNMDPKELLPVSIEVSKAAIVIGNAASPSLLVAEFQRSEGTYGIVSARSKHDLHKNVLNLTFQSASICYVDNKGYDEHMNSTGQKIHHGIRNAHTRPLRLSSYLSFHAFAQLWTRLKLWNTVGRRTRFQPFTIHGGIVYPTSWNRRRGHKSLDEETPLGADFASMEYAKEPKILEAPTVEMLYYADAVGLVPEEPEPSGFIDRGTDPFDIGNGDLPPEWGVDLVIRGGFLRYGPWADRQRAILQQVFFPPNYADIVPHTRLKPGDSRMWTCLKMLIELRDGVTLQLPFREPSKNWQWDGEVQIPNRPRKRDAASIHVRAGDNSTISYMMPMIATTRGFEPTLNVHLDTVTVTSSLNDIRLITADSCVVRCELPSALRWNDQRQWTFAITLRKPTLFLLRDHINMFTDLGKDWASGSPASYNRFVPMQYMLDIHMENYELNTYVNDHNIIDKPLLRDENALLSMRGVNLHTSILIPFNKFRPASTDVSFRIEGPDVAVGLTLPKWNTRTLYSSAHKNSDIGRIGFLRIDVSYCYHIEVHPDNVDQLRLEIAARDVIYKACGWTIRHFMILRNNYFGSFTHFSTLYEYLEKQRLGQPLGDPVDLQYREGSANSLQVHLGAVIDSGLIIMPAGLRGYERDQAEDSDNDNVGTCMMLSFPQFQVYLRSHDYFMEMSINVDTIFGTIHANCSENLGQARSNQREARETFVVDGLDVLAHRLFGPQPHTTTYLCIWEIHAGAVKASLNAWEARVLKAAGRAFGLNYTDPLNAPAAEYEIPSPPDVTFVKISLDMLNVVWLEENVSVELALPRGFRMDSNDLAGNCYSKVTSFRVPRAYLKVLVAANSAAMVWHEALEVVLDANIDMYSAPSNWPAKARIQSEFLAAQDSHTGRAIFMYMPDQTVPYDALAPGRGLLDTEFYIPQLRIPKPAVGKSSKMFPKQTTKSTQLSDGLAPHRPNLYSESEEEEWISEADRDARLAQSRPVHNLDIDNDNGSLSSGDESDNEDLTEPAQSDTESVTSPASVPGLWPIFQDYSHVVRRYEPRHLRRPAWWTKSPYHLLKERAYSLEDRVAHDNEQRADESFSPWDDLRVKFDDAVNTSITRIASKNDITVWFCPMISPAVEVLLRRVQADSQQLSPELRFDNLLADHTQSFTAARPTGEKSSVLDISLASIQISTFQSLRQAKHDALHDDNEPNGALRSDDSTIDCVLKRFRAKVLTSNVHRPPAISYSLASFVTGVGLLRCFNEACNFSLGQSTVSFANQSLLASFADTVWETKDHALVHIFATSTVLMRCLEGLRTTTSSYTRFMSVLDLHLVLQTVKLARDRTIVDPLSTIQPSYLIQSGRPHKLRTDVLFKYLVHLRNTLQCLGTSERHDLLLAEADAHDVAPTEEVKSLVEDHLMQFGADTQFTAFPTSSPFKDLISLQTDDPSEHQSIDQPRALVALSVKLNSFRAVLCAMQDKQSEFIVEPLIIAFRMGSGDQPLIQMANATKSSTTLSLARHEIRQLGLIISVGGVVLSVNPALIRYAQTAIRTTRRYRSVLFPAEGGATDPSSRPTSTASGGVPGSTTPVFYYADVVLTTRTLIFTAGAENLIVEYKVEGIDYTSAWLIKPSKPGRSMTDISMNHSLAFNDIRLQAYAAADISRPDEYAVLAAFSVSGGRVNAVLRQEPEANMAIRVVLRGENVLVNVPRSAMRLCRFIEEWRADYLPGIESMIRSLLSELSQGSQRKKSASLRSKERKGPPTLHVDLSLALIRISLQVMRGTWLAWEFGKILTYFYSPEPTRKVKARTFGLQLGYQTFIISSKAHSSDATPNVRVRMPLPTFSFAGNHDGDRIESFALLEFFSVTVKPSHWDTVLSVQQKFGQDFNDLVAHIAESRSKKPERPAAVQTDPWKYRVVAKMKGFSIGLDGLSSILFLDCDHVGGTVSNDAGTGWHVELADLALSLASHSERREHVLKNSHKRSVFVVIDAQADMRNSSKSPGKRLDLKVTKIHAVMQPSSIGQLGDFVDHIQAETMIRKEQRAQELADFKEKTKKFMRTFELKSSPSEAEQLSWLDRYSINVVVMNVGVAFPLTFNHNARAPQPGLPTEGAVKAFLFAIKSVSFGTQRGESGQASMKGFSFQFVSHFRQNVPHDFSGEGHSTRNRLRYPEMTAQLRSERSNNSRQLHIAANVDGFILDIDSSIPDYISSVIEVYRQGKERVDRLAGAVPRVTPVTEIPQPVNHGLTEQQYNALPTSNVFLSLTFRSGRVRMFSEAYAHASRSRAISTPAHEYTEEQIREFGAEIFDLPVVSVWGEYRATPASTKVYAQRSQVEPSTLVFKSTVHSSQNTLRPTLLPFLTEVVSHVEERMRKTNVNDNRSLFLPVPNTPSASPEMPVDHAAMPTSSMQISLSLRIDQSKLEFTCQPDVNVVAGLNWDSGGFVVNISPGAHRVTFSGTVGGLTIGLKHGFLSEQCMTLHARNLAFSVDFAKARGKTVSTVSIVCDTELSGSVQFSRLQDILCFKAVWLDRIPVINAPAVTPGSSKSKFTAQLTAAASQSKQELSTGVLVRLRRVELDVNLGSSITSVKLNLSNAVMRTRVTDVISEVSLSVHEVSATAAGNLAGHLDVPDFLFQTTRKTDRIHQAAEASRMLDLRMTSGPLEVELESEYQKILLYRAEPLNVRISDDWSTFSSTVPWEERRVHLTFMVEGTEIVAIMNVGTVPRLVSYGAKFKTNLDAQKEGASRESQAFRISNSPRPENALSEVANAMFNSARSKFMEADSGFSCIIVQHLSLKLKTLRLVVFPRSMSDPELAQFIGSEVHARLDRQVQSDALPPERDLQLSFSTIAISKLSQLHHGVVSREQSKGTVLDTKRWLTLLTQDVAEATIFSLPSMDMRMHSDEYLENGARILPYDFSSKFSGKHGSRDAEDIYITLNMSLYAWLTILRKTFAREMDQVRTSTEAQAPLAATVQPPVVSRRGNLERPMVADKETRATSQSPERMSPSTSRSPLQHTRSLPTTYHVKPLSTSGVSSPAHGAQTASSVGAHGTSPVEGIVSEVVSTGTSTNTQTGITYRPLQRHIERLTMRQLGEATPDVMHPFFMKTSGFNLEDSLPQYVHEYATMPTEEIMKALLKLYSKQLSGDSITNSGH